MSKKEQEKEIKEITKKIVKSVKPEKVILFGSYAWGKPNKNSDVDLFVLKNSRKTRRERQLELRKKLFNFNIPIDVLCYTPKETKNQLDRGDFFIRDIIKKGKILYAK